MQYNYNPLLRGSFVPRQELAQNLFRIAAGLALLATLGYSQVETAQISGKVLDPSGAVVRDAEVSLTKIGTDFKRTAKSDAEGSFLFPSVLPSSYQLRVAAPGFSTKQRVVSVAPGQKVGVDFTLEVGTAETMVQVSEEALAVNTVTETVGATIGTKQILELPSLTRNPYDFVATLGNVSPNDPAGRGVGYAINGLRSSSTNVLLDGAANNNEFTASVGQDVPLDAVQEYSVSTTNFTAEVGRATGGVVNVVTKQGTNQFHGTGYWFNRVSALGSNDFDNNANSVTKPVYTRNQPGYSIGGPIKKNKLYFFQSTEWIRVRSQASAIHWIPTSQLVAASAVETRNFFSAFGAPRAGLNVLETLNRQQLVARGFDPCRGAAAGGPCNQLSPTLPLFSRVQYSLPSNSGGGSPQNTWFQVGRVDYNMSDKTQMYVRYALEKSDLFAGTNANSPYAGFDTGQNTQNNSLVASAIHTISPTLVSQSKFVFTRFNNVQGLGTQPLTPTLYFGNQAAPSILGYSVGAPGYLPFSPGSAIPFGGPQNFAQVYQDLNWNKGKHNLRFGGSINYLQDNRTFGAYANAVQSLGSNFGQSMDNLLQGQLRSFNGAIYPQGKFPCVGGVVTPQCTVTLPVASPNFSRSFRYREWAAYIQDSYRASRRLTLSLGLRYEYYGVQHNNRTELDSNFFPGSGGSVPATVRGGSVSLVQNSPVGGFWKPQKGNFAPRLGFAYDLFGDGKTSIRGGYGLGYERNFGNVTFNVIQNPPNYAVIGITAGVDVPRIPISTSNAGPLAGSTGSRPLGAVTLRAVDPNIQTAYAQMWNVSLERQVSPGWLTAIEYTGSKGSKLYSIANYNMVGAGNVWLGDKCASPGDPFTCTARLNSQYGNINFRGNSGFSHYNGLNFRNVFKNIARSGLNMTVNYTWSHAIDNLSDTFSSAGSGNSGNSTNLGFLDPYNPKLDKGNADFDVRHRLVIGGTWDVPFAKNTKGITRRVLDGWTFAPIITLRSGQVFSIFDSTNAYYFITPRAMFDKSVSITGQGDSVPVASQPNTFKYLDLAKAGINSDFVNPITGTAEFGPFPGNMSGRNRFVGPANWNIDLAVLKNVAINERIRAQLRFETYNSINHANLFAVGGTDVSGTDYVAANKFGNRNVQLAIKFIF